MYTMCLLPLHTPLSTHYDLCKLLQVPPLRYPLTDIPHPSVLPIYNQSSYVSVPIHLNQDSLVIQNHIHFLHKFITSSYSTLYFTEHSLHNIFPLQFHGKCMTHSVTVFHRIFLSFMGLLLLLKTS